MSVTGAVAKVRRRSRLAGELEAPSATTTGAPPLAEEYVCREIKVAAVDENER